jgi:hypothetical protein
VPPWRRQLGLMALLLGFLALGLVYNWSTPIFESGDEISHYPFVKLLADGGGLPVERLEEKQDWRQEGSQPPLYYALMAAATGWLDTSDFAAVRQLNPHTKLALGSPDNLNLVIHNPAGESFPWQGTVLAVQVIRLLSLLLAAASVACTYFACLLIFPDRPRLALGAGALHAFNPMFLATSASVSNDTLATLAGSLAIYLALRLLLQSGKVGWRLLWLLGITLAAAALSKISALTVGPVVGLALLVAAWPRRDWPLLGRAALAWGLPVLALAGWWFVRNWQLYGDPTAMQLFVTAMGARPAGFGLADALGEWEFLRHTFWGVFGGTNVPPSPWLWWAGDVLFAAAALGLLLWSGDRLRRRQGLGWPVGLLLLWAALQLAGVLRYTLLIPASVGRLLFPALTAYAILLALGLATLGNAGGLPFTRRASDARRRGQDFLGLALVPALAVAALVVAVVDIHPVYEPTPPLSAAAVAAIPNRADAVYGGRLALVGYDLDRAQAAVGETLRLTLYWRALAPVDRDYSVYVHLVDGRPEEKLGQNDSFPDGGRRSFRQLAPGEVIADPHLLRVQRAPESGAQGQLLVGLYDTTDDSRPAVADSAGRPLGTQQLASLAIPFPPRLPEGATALAANFDSRLELQGYRWATPQLRRGQPGRVVLYWRPLGPLERDYTLFAQLVDANGKLVAQNDHQPRGGQLPTSRWAAGEWVADTFELTPSGAGPYQLRCGWYDLATGRRLPLAVGPGQPAADYVLLPAPG